MPGVCWSSTTSDSAARRPGPAAQLSIAASRSIKMVQQRRCCHWKWCSTERHAACSCGAIATAAWEVQPFPGGSAAMEGAEQQPLALTGIRKKGHAARGMVIQAVHPGERPFAHQRCRLRQLNSGRSATSWRGRPAVGHSVSPWEARRDVCRDACDAEKKDARTEASGGMQRQDESRGEKSEEGSPNGAERGKVAHAAGGAGGGRAEAKVSRDGQRLTE